MNNKRRASSIKERNASWNENPELYLRSQVLYLDVDGGKAPVDDPNLLLYE